MRVERAKSDESNVSKAEARARNVQPPAASNTSTPKATDAPNQAAFSKFLDVARQTSDDDRTEQKGDSASETSVDKQGEGKKDGAIEAKDTNRDDQRSSSGENGGDDNPGLATAPILAPDRASDTGSAVPQARAILHVADLERIVSSVRSDSFAGAKQVTIDLKNSVLEGLRIQLTLTEQGTIKAEFLAVNEEIKKQLDARRNELQSILKDRSIKCSDMQVTLVDPREEKARVEWNNKDA